MLAGALNLSFWRQFGILDLKYLEHTFETFYNSISYKDGFTTSTTYKSGLKLLIVVEKAKKGNFYAKADFKTLKI